MFYRTICLAGGFKEVITKNKDPLVVWRAAGRNKMCGRHLDKQSHSPLHKKCLEKKKEQKIHKKHIKNATNTNKIQKKWDQAITKHGLGRM